MNKNIDFQNLFDASEESTELLNSIGSIENLGFTKDQVRFINVLIETALRRYHSDLIKE